MSKSKKQNKRQLAVLEDLFTGKLEEAQALQKHHVRPNLFERWLTDERFAKQFEQRIARAQRQSRVILARHAASAATKLVHLMDSKNEETARKACLDLISLHASSGRQGSLDSQPNADEPLPVHSLSAETASRLLAALAEEEPHANVDPA
jgi:hypothetical protein